MIFSKIYVRDKVKMFSLSLETWQDNVGTKLIVLWNMNRWKYMGKLVQDSGHLKIFKSEKLHISPLCGPRKISVMLISCYVSGFAV